MTAVALRCAAFLRRTSLILGILLLAIIAIPYQIDPLRFPWHVVSEGMPMRLLALPGIGLAMVVLGMIPTPMLLTRTLVVLIAGIGVLAVIGTAPGVEIGLTGALPLVLIASSLVLLGAAGIVRRLAPWSSIPRALAAIGIVATLVFYLTPGLVGDGMLLTGLVSALRDASGVALAVGITALVPLLLAALSLSTLLPPHAVGPSWARLIGGVAVALPGAVAATMLLQGGAGTVGLATIVAIVLICGFVWPSAGLGVLAFGLFSGDEPEEESGAARDDFDPSQFFGDKTQQMEAWEPEPTEDAGEATRIVQPPAEFLRRTARAPEERPQAPAPRRVPPTQERRLPSAQEPARPRPPEPDEPDSGDRTVMLERPLGKRRK